MPTAAIACRSPSSKDRASAACAGRPTPRRIIFDASSDHGQEVFTVSAAPGSKPARVLLNASNASYSHDGKWIYFQSRGQIWKATAAGGNPQAIVEQRGAGQPIESADGKYVYFRSRRGIWRIPTAGGDEEEAFVPEHDMWGPAIMQPTKKGVYYTEFERSERTQVISFYDFATKKSSIVIPHAKCRLGQQRRLSPYPPTARAFSTRESIRVKPTLMLVENFR